MESVEEDGARPWVMTQLNCSRFRRGLWLQFFPKDVKDANARPSDIETTRCLLRHFIHMEPPAWSSDADEKIVDELALILYEGIWPSVTR